MKAAQRKALPKSEFVYKEKKAYPIDTLARARNALARAAQSKTSGDYATVARAVRAKYGDQIETKGKPKGKT
jgi:hypothetical protein